MSVYRPGDGVPWASRRENQLVVVTRTTWRSLLDRLDELERRVSELEKRT